MVAKHSHYFYFKGPPFQHDASGPILAGEESVAQWVLSVSTLKGYILRPVTVNQNQSCGPIQLARLGNTVAYMEKMVRLSKMYQEHKEFGGSAPKPE